ncbi:Sec-independent protein translocase TatC [Desulfuromonas soudanensis]|uniref:Sec-independent protein translocase protein TatC n=1 Tax=Desulfuromonas soudanensis TaxID=1603606 RepID=A0A0M4DJQ7_9BACT|nr:twin-arginine translocase subunit TatC [Desulfuromonas soudanensis]ALC17382.1 Sec-independent protein translocase TatC [Desulfuromonas soudanensis]
MLEGQKPLTDHLEDLRKKLMIAGGCWLVCFLLLLNMSARLFHWLSAPLQEALPPGSSLVFLSATEPVFTHLTVAATAALIISLPVILWQFWAFLASALHWQKGRLGAAFVMTSYLCFLSGAWLGFNYIFPVIFKVLIRMGSGSGELDAMLSMGSYLSLALKMVLAFGMVCELPVLMILLARLGTVDRCWFVAQRKYMLIVGFTFGALITPGPDVLSQCSIAIPFVILYEVGILGCRIFGKE